LMVEAES
jgi:hypothetical protein